jgi:hypothetical protein
VKDTRLSILQAEIGGEFDSFDDVVTEWENFKTGIDENNLQSSELRVIGSILHDAYTCIEKILAKIAMAIDGELPSGGAWHSDLLDRMSLDIPEIRPRVINAELKDQLYDYMRFRHVFRNVYGPKLKPNKMLPLIHSLPQLFLDFKDEINKFFQNLETITSG